MSFIKINLINLQSKTKGSMKNLRLMLTIMLSFMVLGMNAQGLTKGVSKELADERKENISNVIYDLTFNIPSNVNEKITGKNIITFDLKEKKDVVLDFLGDFSGTAYVITGKRAKRKAVQCTYRNEHIVIPSKL